MKVQELEVSEEALEAFCKKHEIASLSLFGSVLRDDFTEASDIDVLVEFVPSKRLGLYGFGEIELELATLLGRTVDLHTPDSLSKYFREAVLAEAEPLYVAA